MRSGDQIVKVRNHWLNDGFSDLVDSVALLLTGKQSVSTRWQREVSGGSFVDLVADPHGGLSIVVNEFGYGSEAATADTIWSALRGDVTFNAHVPLGDFVKEFTRSLRRIRAQDVDQTGFIEQWQHTFPQSSYEWIERTAVVRFGYKAVSTRELLGEE
jgi:hypothetical protein